jgi:hypothetical protein
LHIAYLETLVTLAPYHPDGQRSLTQALDASVIYAAAGQAILGSAEWDLDGRPKRMVYLDVFEIDRRVPCRRLSLRRFSWGEDSSPRRELRVSRSGTKNTQGG